MLDQHYWAEKDDDDDSGSVPFWYQLGAKASSIEATSYALLVFLQSRGQMEHIDSIADWLVGQRNENGAFVGAMVRVLNGLLIFMIWTHIIYKF